MSPTLRPLDSGSPQPRPLFQPVRRPRISQLLDSASSYPATILIAGAGYGKTVALEHWLAARSQTVARYEVREGSHGLSDFVIGLARALQPHARINPKAAAGAVNSAEGSDAPELDLAAWAANALRKFNGLIVIDDYHVAAADDPAVSRFLARTIELTGDSVRWLVATRSACGLPISSWIAYGKSQMAIGERELSFTHEEAAQAAADFGAHLTAAQLNELFAYTAGWATAVAFALLGAERTFDLAELRASTQELSYQYLAEQVFRGLTAIEADFMMRSSVFDRMDVDILSAAGFSEPRARIQYLKDHAPFIVRDSEGGIRYHDLFRDFLRNELSKNDEAFASAWNAAGETYERLQQYSQALSAYQCAGATNCALRVLAAHGFGLIERGQRRVVLSALHSLSARADIDGSATILALRANCEANTGSAERAEAWYRQAIAAASSTEQRAELSLQFARELVQRNRLEGIDILEPVLRDDLPLALKVSIMGTLATYYWQANRCAEALALVEAALAQAAPLSDDEIHARLLHQSAYILLLAGQIKEATSRAMKALRFATAMEMHALCARIHSLLYYIHATGDNVAEALWWTKQMERSAFEAGDMLLRLTAVGAMYELDVERGNFDSLPRLAEQLREFDAQKYVRTSQAILPSLALQAAWQRRFDESLSILGGTEESEPTPHRRALRAAEVALYAAAAGSRERAERAAAFAAEQMRHGYEAEAYVPKRLAKTLVFLALSQLLLGKASSANRYIGEAEKMSGTLSLRSKALVRSARSMYAHAETRVLDAEVEQGFADLQATGYAGMARMLRELPIPNLAREATAAALTRTEIDVLRAIERHGDSKAAGAALSKSSHTIDWHVKAIVKKLAVANRHEAVSFAKERGLIG